MDIDIGVKDIDWTHRIGTKTENKRLRGIWKDAKFSIVRRD